jgi:putative membrane protein
MSFVLRLAVNAAALYAATRLVDGIRYTGEPLGLAGVALVFAAVNTFIRPVVKFFSFPVILLTLGFFTLIINGVMLLLTARLSAALGFSFTVQGFGAAFWGALVISLVSLVLGALLGGDKKKRED